MGPSAAPGRPGYGHDGRQYARSRHCSRSAGYWLVPWRTTWLGLLRSAAGDEKGLVGRGCPHRSNVPETSGPNLGFELLGCFGH